MTRFSSRIPALLCVLLLTATPAAAAQEADKEAAGTKDADGDGYAASVDCDDNNAESTVRASDADCDGLKDAEEAEHGTNAELADTDGDGIPDGREVLELETDPLDEDDYRDPDATEVTATTDDPITVRLRNEVQRYYSGIGTEATEAELRSGIDSTRFMLLDGVSIHRISAAVDKAISLHTPGRRVSFEVAVPLRVMPAEKKQQGATAAGEAGSVNGTQPVQDPAIEEGRARRREAIEARRNRIRLYRQWQTRTTGKRILLSVGVPSLAVPYTLGFFIASIYALSGIVPASWAWVTAVPVVGTLLLGVWTESQFPGFALLTVAQLGGLAAVIVGLALKMDRPYDKDPTALRIGKRRDGRSALTIRSRPMGLGGILEGRF